MQLTIGAVRALLPFAAVAALSGGLTACGGDDDATPAQATSPAGDGGGARGVGVNPADAAYVRQMIPHDAQVVVFASQLGATSTNPEIKALAQSSRESVTKELRALREFAVARRYDLDKADVRRDDDAEALGTTTEKISTPTILGASDGTAGDKAFVKFLIQHHEGSLVMSRAVRKVGNDEALKTLSGQNVKQLRDELEQLRDLEDQL